MFSQIIGQEDIKARLIQDAENGRIAHAILFSGPSGCGKLALAIAYARYLLCQQPHKGNACGQCSSCRTSANFAHPDLHFVYPIIKYKKTEDSISDAYIKQWRERLGKGLYFDMEDWLSDMKAGNQQTLIYAAESEQIQRKLSLKSTMGGRKVMVIWMPEKMHSSCANKLLKLIEEPPTDTIFLMVSEEPDKILPTIISRTQRIEFKGVETEKIAEALSRYLPTEDAMTVARSAQGNYTQALKVVDNSRDNALFLNLFIMLMRLSYLRKIKEMRKWSEQMAGMGREKQKAFLEYSLRLIRENFVYNFRLPELNYMTKEEAEFAKNFARFVNERNVIKIMDEINRAARDIEQNTNPKMVFFDFALKMIVLLIQ